MKNEDLIMQRKLSEAPLPVMRKLISNLRLFPKTHDFFSYFEKSISFTVEGAKLLQKCIADSGPNRAELAKQIKDIEHECDKVTHEVIDLLRSTFLTPFDRSDMYLLIVKLDDVMDIINFVGNRVSRYHIKKMPEEMPRLAGVVLRATEELAKAIPCLANMKNSQKILNHCIEINRLENEADEQINNVIEVLFNDNFDALQVIMIKEIVENLEVAADKCEDVANIIEGIILKHS